MTMIPLSREEIAVIVNCFIDSGEYKKKTVGEYVIDFIPPIEREIVFNHPDHPEDRTMYLLIGRQYSERKWREIHD